MVRSAGAGSGSSSFQDCCAHQMVEDERDGETGGGVEYLQGFLVEEILLRLVFRGEG